MDSLRRLPFLKQLSPVELAKLLPEIQVINLAPGDRLDSDEVNRAIQFVEQGRIELRSEAEDRATWISHVPAGDFFGEAALLDSPRADVTALALEASRIVVIPAQTFREVLRARPQAFEDFNHAVLKRSSQRFDELIRVRRMMAVYSEQLWSHPDIEDAVALSAQPQQHAGVISMPVALSRKRKRESEARGTASWRPSPALLKVGVATVIAAAFAMTAAPQLAANVRYTLAILLWSSVCWLLNALPDYVIAIAACVGVGATGLATPALALSGFANPTWFMLLGTWCIGSAIARTGLLYRVALYILRLLPATYLGQSLALAITGTLVTPLLPSSQGRLVMAAPLTLELSEAMRFSQHSSGAAGLGMSGLLGFGQMYFLFLNGTTTVVLAWTLLPPAVRSQVSWLFWLVAALPLGIIVFLLTFWATMRLFRVDKAAGISRALIDQQLQVLGPMRPAERIGLYVILGVLVAFISTPLHGVDPAWFAVTGMLVLIVTNVMDKESLSSEVDWSFLLFFGAIISIANIARSAQLDLTLSELIRPMMAPVMGHPAAAVLVVGLLTLALRCALSPIQVIPLMTIALVPLFSHAGYNPFGIVLTVIAASTTFAAPRLSPNYMTMHAGTRGRMFTHKQVLTLALVHSGSILLGILCSVPYWTLLKAL